MAKKMVGKVVAGAALGGASLLMFTPAMALAAGHHDGEDEGKVYAKPDAVRAGDQVKLIEVCEKPQKHPFVWSKVTGKVELHPVRKDHGDGKDHEEEAAAPDPDQLGKDGKDQQGGEEPGGDDHGKGPDGGYEYPKPPADGLGGGLPDDASPAADPDWTGHEEYGQEEYGSRDGTGHDGHGMDEYGRGEADKGEGGHWEHPKDFVYYGEATVSAGATPGTYKLKGSCGEGELTVLPTGPVDGGDGGMNTTSTDRGLAAGGASLLGAAALGGIVLLRRRRADGLV